MRAGLAPGAEHAGAVWDRWVGDGGPLGLGARDGGPVPVPVGL